jgi:hypothetical protein
MASRVAPKLAEYPSATEYSDKNVNGNPLPPACKNAAPTLHKKAGLRANFKFTCVGLLPTKREGEAVIAIGSETSKLRKQRKRSVHLGPIAVIKARIRGEKTSPPIPAPERMNPIAEPRCVVKYSGAAKRMGKYRRELPRPKRRP